MWCGNRVFMDSWPRLALREDGPTTIVYTASSVSIDINNILGDDYNFELCLRKLSLTEQLRVRNAKYNRNKTLILGLFSRIVLNHALFSSSDDSSVFEPFNALELVHNEFGKPSLCATTGSRIEFNSSTSNEIMSIIVQLNGNTPVGIDVSHERQDSISETRFMEQFEGIFSESEQAQLKAVESLQERYLLFNQFWTLKEAFTKFVGCGLNVDLSTFHFDVGPKKPLVENPRKEESQYFKELQLAWQEDIVVDFQNLDPKFGSKISCEPVFCRTSVLKCGPSLPVFISVISQVNLKDLKVIEINLETVLKSVLDV